MRVKDTISGSEDELFEPQVYAIPIQTCPTTFYVVGSGTASEGRTTAARSNSRARTHIHILKRDSASHLWRELPGQEPSPLLSSRQQTICWQLRPASDPYDPSNRF